VSLSNGPMSPSVAPQRRSRVLCREIVWRCRRADSTRRPWMAEGVVAILSCLPRPRATILSKCMRFRIADFPTWRSGCGRSRSRGGAEMRRREAHFLLRVLRAAIGAGRNQPAVLLLTAAATLRKRRRWSRYSRPTTAATKTPNTRPWSPKVPTARMTKAGMNQFSSPTIMTQGSDES